MGKVLFKSTKWNNDEIDFSYLNYLKFVHLESQIFQRNQKLAKFCFFWIWPVFSHILALEWYLFIAYFFFIQGNTSSNKGITKILCVITFFKKKKSSLIWWLQWNPCKSWKDTHKLIKVKKHVNMFFFYFSTSHYW